MRILELRQYTLLPGRRDDLIELFEREFVESQEELGMTILGTFRDLDNPDRFVWLRGFSDMSSRRQGLTDFYTGPAWKAHRDQANATMDDVSNVLLLRPVRRFPPMAARPAVGHTTAPGSVITATIHYRDEPFDDDLVRALDRSSGRSIGTFRTEYAENDFPALPIRTGVHAFVRFDRDDRPVHTDGCEDRDDPSAPTLASVTSTERLRLSPTARSLLR